MGGAPYAQHQDTHECLPPETPNAQHRDIHDGSQLGDLARSQSMRSLPSSVTAISDTPRSAVKPSLKAMGRAATERRLREGAAGSSRGVATSQSSALSNTGRNSTARA